jgi:energy-coupling factor transporter ATP-binding protein EcfA2
VSTVIECERLTKRYPTATLALDGLDLEIAAGTSFGLVGENGAGKTTFVKLVMGFIFPTAGRLRVLEHSHVGRAHPRIGYMLLPACLIASIAILLSPPVGNRITLTIFLAWLIVIFRRTRASAGLPPDANSALNALWVPLRPVSDSIFASTHGITASSSLAPILLQTAYLVGITVLAGVLLERRTLDLH